MRKKHKEKDKKGIFLVLFIALIMLTSTIGYVFKESSNEKYNGFSFSIGEDQRWHTKINGIQMSFKYFPADLEAINLSSNIVDRIKTTNMIYFTHDLKNRYSGDIALLKEIFWPYFQVYAEIGLTEKNDFGLPLIDCNNATSAAPVIYITESNQTGFYMDNNCITCEINSREDFIAVKERLLYSLFGVME